MLKLKEFQKEIKKHVKGQNEAVNKLSSTIFKFLLKAVGNQDYGLDFRESSSILLIGPTGTGKTYMARTACELLGRDLIEIDCKTIGLGGSWSGSGLDDILLKRLVGRSKPKHKIIFLDEFDKILKPSYTSKGEDYNKQLQDSLLKLIEGREIPEFGLHTKNFLFILGGAFTGLQLKQKINKIGFLNHKETDITISNALLEFGMIPELCGRVQEKVLLNNLTKQHYKEILNSNNFNNDKWKNILSKIDINLKINKNKLIKDALKNDLGVRGLSAAIEDLVTKYMAKHINEVDLEKFSPLYTKSNKKLASELKDEEDRDE